MSEYIPLELQMETMKRLPVKSLIRFRSVSKAWNSLIDSADFVKSYSSQRTNQQHLFLTYYDCDDKYVSIADDHTFPHHKVFLTLPPWLLDYDYELIGCSHGLLCFYYPQEEDQTNIALLWNFSIRKALALVVPNVVNNPIDTTVLGFGVCRETSDPKIVKITQFIRGREMDNASCIPCQVEVFTLSTRTWRAPYSTNLPRKSITLGCFYQVVEVDGFVYWLATDRITADGGFIYYNLIISFDPSSEEFREVNLPDCLEDRKSGFSLSLSLSKLRESLVVLEHGEEANNRVISVWMMEDGVSKLFTKLFTVTVNTRDATVKGFTKSGEPIISFSKDGSHGVFYEPCSSDKVVTDRIACSYPYSKHSDKVVIDCMFASYFLISYMETLLLLNEPDLKVHNEMETLKFEDDLLLEPNFSF